MEAPTAPSGKLTDANKEEPNKASMFRGTLQEITLDLIKNKLQLSASGPPVLELSMQQIKTLNDLQAPSPIELGELDLHGNFVLSIHPNFFASFQKLKTLHLGSNSLKEFPPLQHLTSLEDLQLSSNFIPAIPHQISLLTDLRVLDLRKNRIAVLENLKGLSRLEYLSLSCNRLTHISPTGLAVHPQLRFLGLFGNQLTLLTPALDLLTPAFPNLREILLGGNPCTLMGGDSYRAEVLKRFPSLELCDWEPTREEVAPLPSRAPVEISDSSQAQKKRKNGDSGS